MRLSALKKKGKSLSFTFRNSDDSKANEPCVLDFAVPLIVKDTVDYLLQHDGVGTEGIFRVTGSLADVEKIYKKYTKEKSYGLGDTANVHTVAGVLKHYIRQTLIPSRMHECLLATAAIEHEDTRIVCMRKALALLPGSKRLTLLKICDYLAMVQSNEETNKMGAYNLSLIFGSTFLPVSSGDLTDAVNLCSKANKFAETILLHHKKVLSVKDYSYPEIDDTSLKEQVDRFEVLLLQLAKHKDELAEGNKKKRGRRDSFSIDKPFLTLRRGSNASSTVIERVSGALHVRRNSDVSVVVSEDPANSHLLSPRRGGLSVSQPLSPRGAQPQNKYMEEILAEKMCRKEEVELLAHCLALGEKQLYQSHLQRIAKDNSHIMETIQNAIHNMNIHKRKSSI